MKWFYENTNAIIFKIKPTIYKLKVFKKKNDKIIVSVFC